MSTTPSAPATSGPGSRRDRLAGSRQQHARPRPARGRLGRQDRPGRPLLAVDDPDARHCSITSFRTADDANSTGWWTVFTDPANLDRPDAPELQRGLRSKAEPGQAFINSFAITLPATFIPILIAAFAAYAFTFMQFPGRDILFVI